MTQVIEIKYGLLHKQTRQLITYHTSPNNGDFCTGTQFILDIERDGQLCYDSERVWTVDRPKHAEWVRQNSTEWYNATYDTPTHHFEPDDLEVVKIEIKATTEPVKIPTPQKFYEQKHAKKDPKYLEYLAKNGFPGYSLYDLETEGYFEINDPI